jgi:hypothetical protein
MKKIRKEQDKKRRNTKKQQNLLILIAKLTEARTEAKKNPIIPKYKGEEWQNYKTRKQFKKWQINKFLTLKQGLKNKHLSRYIKQQIHKTLSLMQKKGLIIKDKYNYSLTSNGKKEYSRLPATENYNLWQCQRNEKRGIKILSTGKKA